MSAISLCSRALVKIGAAPISSFNEYSAEARVAAVLYPMIRDSLLSSYTWSFATANARLPRLSDGPEADYRYAYRLPHDMLRIISAGVGGRGRGIDYKISENRLHANSEEVMLTYIFRPKEEIMPPYFTKLLVTRLAAEFASPLTESMDKAGYLDAAAEREFKAAKQLDAGQGIPPALESFPLIEVRS